MLEKINRAPNYKIQNTVDKFETRKFSIKMLFIPVAHFELSPIEMVWSFVKQSVASRNINFHLSSIEELTGEQIVKITSELFNKDYIHACRQAYKYQELSVTTDA